MSINYFRENLKKFDHDNLISFLFDILLRINIDEIEDFDINKEYNMYQKVYVKDIKGKHHIYNCIVEKSTIGQLKDDEWIDLIQSFRKPIITDNNIVTGIDVRQEVVYTTQANQKEFELNTYGVSEGAYTVIIFHPELGRLASTDFQVLGQTVVLNDDCIVKNINGKIVIDLYGKR